MPEPPKPLPWTVTAVEFGRFYPPVRVIAPDGSSAWRYPALGTDARSARALAVVDAHRHFVLKALAEGVEVPAPIRALYLAPPPPIAPDEAQDFTRLAGAPAANAAAGRAAPAELIEQLVSLSSTTTAAVQLLADRQTAQREWIHTTLAGLVKALTQQSDHLNAIALVTRNSAAEAAETLFLTKERQDEILKKVEKTLSKIAAARAKPKRWSFQVRRDANGFIARIDATPQE